MDDTPTAEAAKDGHERTTANEGDEEHGSAPVAGGIKMSASTGTDADGSKVNVVHALIQRRCNLLLCYALCLQCFFAGMRYPHTFRLPISSLYSPTAKSKQVTCLDGFRIHLSLSRGEYILHGTLC
jgi:hypothetical protein